jgi:hypothetical protein
MTVLPTAATADSTPHPLGRSCEPFASSSICTAARGLGKRNSAHNLALEALPVAAKLKADSHFGSLGCADSFKAERRHRIEGAVAAGGYHWGEAARCPVGVLDKGRS